MWTPVALCVCLLSAPGLIQGRENGPKVVKVVVKEGSDALLPCLFSAKEDIGDKRYVWKKDGHREVFLYDAGARYGGGRAGQDEQFAGRVSHFPGELKNGNASLVIRNAKVADSGNYTGEFPHLWPESQILIQLAVESSESPPTSSTEVPPKSTTESPSESPAGNLVTIVLCTVLAFAVGLLLVLCCKRRIRPNSQTDAVPQLETVSLRDLNRSELLPDSDIYML